MAPFDFQTALRAFVHGELDPVKTAKQRAAFDQILVLWGWGDRPVALAHPMVVVLAGRGGQGKSTLALLLLEFAHRELVHLEAHDRAMTLLEGVDAAPLVAENVCCLRVLQCSHVWPQEFTCHVVINLE